MRVKIPDFQSKSELFAHLKANKKKIIAEKRQGVIHSDTIHFTPSGVATKSGFAIKANEPVTEDKEVLRVKVVANTANYIDSHLDMIVDGAYTKTVNERKAVIPHLHDHNHSVEAKVGEVVDIIPQRLSFAELGIKGTGSTEALVFITDVMKSYNEKVFNQYKLGKINQHSIGLQYVKIELAINDPDSEKEFEFWEKYINLAINPEVVEERGFFWVVQEIKLLENSAVLFGSNEITPTLDNDLNKSEPINGGHSNEVKDETGETSEPSNKSEDYNELLSTIKFDL